jgi:hypothetical protein
MCLPVVARCVDKDICRQFPDRLLFDPVYYEMTIITTHVGIPTMTIYTIVGTVIPNSVPAASIDFVKGYVK